MVKVKKRVSARAKAKTKVFARARVQRRGAKARRRELSAAELK